MANLTPVGGAAESDLGEALLEAADHLYRSRVDVPQKGHVNRDVVAEHGEVQGARECAVALGDNVDYLRHPRLDELFGEVETPLVLAMVTRGPSG